MFVVCSYCLLDMDFAETRRISPISNAGALLFLVWSALTIFGRNFDFGVLNNFLGSLIFIRIFSIEVPFDLVEFFFKYRVGVFALIDLFFVAIIVVSIFALIQKRESLFRVVFILGVIPVFIRLVASPGFLEYFLGDEYSELSFLLSSTFVPAVGSTLLLVGQITAKMNKADSRN